MRSAVACVAILLAAGCSFEVHSPAATNLAVSGRVERSLTVHVALVSDGRMVPGAVFTLSPDTLATVSGDSITLLMAGSLTVEGSGTLDGASVQASVTLNVSAPPAILFDDVVSGNRDIYTAQLDGAGFRRVTLDPGDDRQPTTIFGLVTFVSYRTGSAQLFTVPFGGGAEVQLTPSSTAGVDVTLTGDGAHLAFAAGTGFPRIMVGSGDGSSVTRLAAAGGGGSGSIEESPAWAPTNDRVAYMTTRDGLAGIYIAMLHGDSGSATQLVSGANGYANVEPSWSPDGTSIAFASNRDGPTDLYLVTISTGAVQRLTTRGNVGEPAFLLDGRIVFTEFASGAFALRWLDPADTAVVHSIPTGAGSAQHPAPVR